jgi:hypothetical protein
LYVADSQVLKVFIRSIVSLVFFEMVNISRYELKLEVT